MRLGSIGNVFFCDEIKKFKNISLKNLKSLNKRNLIEKSKFNLKLNFSLRMLHSQIYMGRLWRRSTAHYCHELKFWYLPWGGETSQETCTYRLFTTPFESKMISFYLHEHSARTNLNSLFSCIFCVNIDDNQSILNLFDNFYKFNRVYSLKP